jgi:hypothetical protein
MTFTYNTILVLLVFSEPTLALVVESQANAGAQCWKLHTLQSSLWRPIAKQVLGFIHCKVYCFDRIARYFYAVYIAMSAISPNCNVFF